MSRAALALGVRDQLRAPALSGGLALPAAECEVTLLGMPPPLAGERFVGVYAGARSAVQVTYGLREAYTIIIAITMRCPRVPSRKLGTDLIAKAAVGLDALADAVRAVIGKDYATGKIRARANAIIGDTYEINQGNDPGDIDQPRGFEGGLNYLGESDPEPVSGSWFSSEEDEPLAGVVIRQRYGGCFRVQSWLSASVT